MACTTGFATGAGLATGTGDFGTDALATVFGAATFGAGRPAGLAGGFATGRLVGLVFGAGDLARTVFGAAFFRGLAAFLAAAGRAVFGVRAAFGRALGAVIFFAGRATWLLLERASALAGGPAGCSRVASPLSTVKRFMRM